MREMNEQGELICPFCLVAVDNGKCPVCKRDVCETDWIVNDHPDISPCRSRGLVKPSEPGYPYQQKDLMPHDVRPDEEMTFRSKKEGHFLTVGGSARFTIEGLSKTHCVIFKKDNGDDPGWWIFDCGEDCSDGKTYVGTRVNRYPVRLRKLKDRDIIEIGSSAKFECEINDGEIVVKTLSDNKDKDEALKVDKLSAKAGQKELLRDVSFSVNKGEFIGIIGRSGCGKSSLIQRIANLAPFTGTVTLFKKEDVPGNEPYCVKNARVVYLPQNVEQSLHDSMTLDEEIASFRKIFECGDVADEDVRTLLGKLRLSDKQNDRIKDFSGGEKRRVGIALALLRNPEMLLLDEPCAGLDPAMAIELMEYLFKLSKIDGKTILCVTHVFDNEDLFDKLLVLRSVKGEAGDNHKHGEVAYFDVPQKIYAKFHRGTLAEVFDVLDKKGFSSTNVNNDGKGWKHCLMSWGSFLVSPIVSAIKRAFRVSCVDLSLDRFGSRLKGYWQRNWRDYCPPVAKRSTFWEKVKSVWEMIKTPVVSFIVQPALIVVGLRLACAFCFRDGGKYPGIDTLSFCATLSVFWLALNNSARELVRERVPERCIERLGGVPMLPYLMSKYLWIGMLCAVQCLVFMSLFWVSGKLPLNFSELTEVGTVKSIDEISQLTIHWASYLPLLASSLIGSFCGLTISAFAKRDIGAAMFVPNVAILALLFSETVMRFTENYYIAGCETFAKFMPCHWPYMVLTNIIEGVNDSTNVWKAIVLVAIYGLISFVLAFFAQRYNERSWQGR